MGKIKIERKSWMLDRTYGRKPISQWGKSDLSNLVTFLTRAGLEVPRVINLRIQSDKELASKAVTRKKGESLRAYRRRLRKHRIKKHGSVGKMRRAKKEQQVKEQRWALLREQGFPLRDPEALVWYLKSNVWKRDSKLVQYGYLRTSALLEVAGGVLPTSIDFDNLYHSLTQEGKAKNNERDRRKEVDDPKTVSQRFYEAARFSLSKAYREAGFRLRNPRNSEDVAVNRYDHGEVGAKMEMRDETKNKYGRNRHYSYSTVRVDLSWYRTVFKKGMANAAGDRSLVLEVVTLANGEKRAMVARQKSPKRYELTVGLMRFGKNTDGTYWFEEA